MAWLGSSDLTLITVTNHSLLKAVSLNLTSVENMFVAIVSYRLLFLQT